MTPSSLLSVSCVSRDLCLMLPQQKQEEEEREEEPGAAMETGGGESVSASSVAEEDDEEEGSADEETTAVAEPGGLDGLEDAPFQLEEEPDTLLAPPAAYGAIEDHMGGNDGSGDLLRDMEDMAGLLLSSDDEGETGMMDVDGAGGGGGGVSQEY